MFRQIRNAGWIALFAAVPVAGTSAQEVGGSPSGGREFQLEGLSVIGHRQEDYTNAPGAAQRIDKETLERDEYDNINRILNEVPGVYIRGEDGFGNRPNIGLRGTTTERSKKITLMVDGVLAAPAPYSAPAAYYFPQVSRMTGVEVVKGPSAITSGPATVGGAINLLTRSIPSEASGTLDLGAGEDGYRKIHAHYGDSSSRGGYLVEGIRTESDGFKNLDGGGDTGFEKNDLMVKGRINSDPAAETYHQLDLSLEYADETSDETYLGLAENDFRKTPYRRYAGSREGLFDWEYRKAQMNHLVELGDSLSVNTTLYYQDFDRAWTKFREFEADRDIAEIFQNPEAGRNRDFLDVLRGVKDSERSAQETLLIETNDREYYARGIQSSVQWQTSAVGLDHDIHAGVRFHQDQVERNHSDQEFQMRSGRLQVDGDPVETLQNRESADALALFVQDEISAGRLRVTPGVRVESIEYESVDLNTGSKLTNDNTEVLPGLGTFYQWTPAFGLLAGVHRGIVPTGPAVGDDVDPEESINYEAGFRYQGRRASGELIGFFNDYSNLLGACSLSTSCSDPTGVFNGGEVDVYGFESRFATEPQVTGGITAPLTLSYTYTETEFQNDFSSAFPLWKEVSRGDRLPYMPRHRLGLSLGLSGSNWGTTLKMAFQSEQKEQSGEGGALEGATVPSYAVFDWKNRWQFTADQEVYLNVNNLFDRDYLLSRRPTGARPGQPRTIKAGYKLSF